MKKILILRHAKAGSEKPVEDHEKPLTDKGSHDAKAMGTLFKRMGAKPELAITSSALRAKTTAKLVTQEVGLSSDSLKTEGKLYNASTDQIIDVVKETDNLINDLMICGHNPGMSDFTNLLTGENGINFHACEAALVSIDIEDWNNLTLGLGKLEKFFPRPE